jgi:hypothetical protein
LCDVCLLLARKPGVFLGIINLIEPTESKFQKKLSH